MPHELVLYTNPMSRGRIARWMLEETGAPYKTELIDYGPPMKSAAYLAINPMGKVPALRHGDVVVTECAAICAYLADAFPAANLAPPVTSPLRGPYYRWLMFTAGPVEAAAANAALGVVVPDEKKGMVGYGSMAAVTDTLDKHLTGRKYIVGDGFTAADVYVGAELGWLTNFGVIEKRPSFASYLEHITARPACKRAAALDDALLPKKG